jgi:hypothetical protein
MKKVCKDFPIYSIKNFIIPSWPLWNKKKIIETIIHNKKYHVDHVSNNFPVLDDDTGFFNYLYEKYYNFCYKKFEFTVHPLNLSTCWTYVSQKDNFVEVWHDHTKTSTISSVYYLNIPKNNTSIDFRLNGNYYTHKPRENELIIFPHYLEHKPNRCYDDGNRISINMEIRCFQNSEDLFSKL